MKNLKSLIRILLALVLVLTLCMAACTAGAEESAGAPNGIAEADSEGWINFLLICNEGMNNNRGNAGNTIMVVAMNSNTGRIRLMMLTWDTFIQYPGYDVPQKIDMPYRNNGAEETVRVFDANFGMDIHLFMSLNYLNLANLIDSYGGVTLDISRAERNALNEMVASKKETIQAQADAGLMAQQIIEMMADEYYLSEYGPDTKLNGLQAVGYGWLQYDSVYNCCRREVKVIARLFTSVGNAIGEKIVLYTNETGRPDNTDGKRVINLDDMTEDDRIFLRREMDPIFQMSYNNLSEDDIMSISLALARAAYFGSRQGVNIFDNLDFAIFPQEAKQPYDVVAGTEGHLIDYEANAEAMRRFLYADN